MSRALKLMEMKRRPMLLLEMLIAFLLMGGVITMLMTGFFDAIRAKNIGRKEKEEILTYHRLLLRFSTLLKDVIEIHQVDKSYYIRCLGGADPDPHFRLEVDAVLGINDKKLMLFTFPPEGSPRREVLAENIESIQFLFFNEKSGTFEEKFPEQKTSMVQIVINSKERLPIFL